MKLETVDIKVTYEKMNLQPKENVVNLQLEQHMFTDCSGKIIYFNPNLAHHNICSTVLYNIQNVIHFFIRGGTRYMMKEVQNKKRSPYLVI